MQRMFFSIRLAEVLISHSAELLKENGVEFAKTALLAKEY